MACRCQGQCHGGVVQVDIFPFTHADASCKLVDDGRKHEAWIQSWRDMVGLPPHVEDFLYHLLAWPEYPVLWLDDDENRTEAPLFIVAHHGRGIKARACSALGRKLDGMSTHATSASIQTKSLILS